VARIASLAAARLAFFSNGDCGQSVAILIVAALLDA
jgi:hypothetical protein